MPAQKRSNPDASPPPSQPPSPPPAAEDEEEVEEEEEEEKEEEVEEQQPKLSPKQEQDSDDDDDDDDEGGSGSASDKDEFIFVKLADIRKEVQCPICLGIIRKTRTVMECLHRFCRECIDKSMRLGNNECPACRTHCASRRSLRDDPNYDALIAALYPDIDKYEEEELAFHEEEKNRNKKIQASIAETFRRQSEALGKRKPTAKATAAAFLRKSRNSHGQNSYLRGRGRGSARDTSLAVSEDEEDEDSNRNDGKESSSADEPSPDRRQKRPRRWPLPRSSPARTTANADITCDENDDGETTRDNRGPSPLRVGNREMLAWGRGGVRSQTRHASGSNGRFVKGGRITKLVEYIRNLNENENEFDVHLELLPMGEQSVANLRRPYICCRPTLTMTNLCQFIALQTSVKDEEVQILVRKPGSGNSELKPSSPSEELQVVGLQESLAALRDSYSNTRGNLVLMYHLKTQS